MKLIINGKEVKYESDYPDGWKYISNDHFKFPVLIGDQRCFIKRFESKGPSEISGWQLLQELKASYQRRPHARQLSNLAQVIEIQEVTEEDKRVSYIFYECLEGKSLDQRLKKPGDIHSRQLVYDIFNALEELHNYGFWFADFCEKNIFCEESGRYLLVDLDSAQPSTAAPHNTMYGSKDYWILIYRFYVNILKRSGFKLADINGMRLDYLQFVFLILHLQLFIESERKLYRSEKDYTLLPEHLDNIDRRFQSLFTSVLSNRTDLLPRETILKARDLIEKKIIKADMNSNSGPSKGAIIHQFSSSSTLVNDGESFILSWNVEADKIDLHRNGVFFQSLGVSQQSLERTEFYDGHKDVTYELIAYKEGVQSRSRPIVIKSASAQSAGSSSQSLNAAIGADLLTMASWARIIAIPGIIFSGVAVIICLLSIGSRHSNALNFLIIVIVIFQLFPLVFLLRFAKKARPGVSQLDEDSLKDAFKNIKYYFIYAGILAIIFYVVALIIILGIAGIIK